MLIPLDDTYAIGSDEHCWYIARKQKRTRNGKAVEEWRQIRWYANPHQAIQGLADLQIRLSDAQTLGQALVDVENVVAGLCGALRPHFKVEVKS